MNRTVARPTRFDPANPRPPPAAHSDLNFTEWGFYENDGYVITFDLIGRAAYHNGMRTNFIYLGRKTAKGVSVIKCSYYEAARVLTLITQFLNEVSIHGRSGNPLIPMLCGREGAKVTLSRDNKDGYFSTSQVQMQNILARLCFSEIRGEYMLHILSPVSAEISTKLKGWLGPIASLTIEDIERLESFLKAVLEPEAE